MTNVFIAAATRSGSTHIKNCFVQLGWKPATTHVCMEGHYNEEHTVSPYAAALLFPMGGFVVHQHTRALGRVVPLLKEYGVRPIVTIRNILDSIVSFKEQTDKDVTVSTQGTYLAQHLPRWAEMAEEEKYLWVVYNIVPWWYSFYVSWLEAPIDRKFVRYNEFFADQVAGMQSLLSWLKMEPAPTLRLKEVTSNHSSKFNVGVTGRGSSLSTDIMQIAYDMADAWGPASKDIWRDLF